VDAQVRDDVMRRAGGAAAGAGRGTGMVQLAAMQCLAGTSRWRQQRCAAAREWQQLLHASCSMQAEAQCSVHLLSRGLQQRQDAQLSMAVLWCMYAPGIHCIGMQ
jgi:hypothetical protein